ncbi:DNA-directed RNA polymerase V subunit 1 [Oryza glaberrima]|uniref:DNA-directed RNA polymerase V subunit 1 n=1 Tax=Oryza glaberrima TaxID=4538 RepID=UPI00224C1337|nr:DNA-directed RNA polymerase V subunit 1 [Oryza glaberrima]
MEEDQSAIPVAEGAIKSIKLSLSTEDEIRTYSINDCPVTHPSQLGNPFLGLPLETGKCESCGASENGKCEGHFGYIELPVPIYHPCHVTELRQILNVVCLKCLRVKKGKVKQTEGKDNTSALSCYYCRDLPALSLKEIKTADGAFRLELKMPPRKFMTEGSWNFLDKYGFHHGGTSHCRTLLPEEALNILKKIPEETKRKLAARGYIAQSGYVMKYLPVPPNCLYIPEFTDGQSIMSYDISISLLKKVLQKIEQIKKSRAGSPNFESHEVESCDLQLSIAQYIHLRGTTRGPQDNTKRFAISTDPSALSTKQWLEKMRTLFISKGSGFSSRSVLTGDPYIGVDVIGLPSEVAKRITFEEQVTDINLNRLQEIVDKGLCLTYRDGQATYAITVGSKGHTTLKVGQTISRRIVDGDVVFLNRPPSTHKHSLQAFRVYVHEDHTVKINPLICAPFAADFDGDCVHIYYPQSLAAKAEALELFSVEKQLTSSHSGKVNLQLVSDSLLALKHMSSRTMLSKEAANQLAMLVTCSLPDPAVIKSKPYWTISQIVQGALPKALTSQGDKHVVRDSTIIKLDLDKESVQTSFSDLVYSTLSVKGPGEALQFLNVLQPLLMELILLDGFSVSLQDFNVPKVLLEEAQKNIEKQSLILEQSRFAENQVVEMRVDNNLKDIKQQISDFVVKRSHLGLLIDPKSDSSVSKVVQQLGFVGLQLYREGKFYSRRLVEDCYYTFVNKHPAVREEHSPEAYGLVRSSYFHGLNPYEELVHAISTREAIVRSSRGLTEPGTLFKNLMALLRDVVICYDGTVRNVCSKSIIQLNYMEDDALDFPSAIGPGEPVGVLAATAISNPAYKAVLDASQSNNTSWERMKEILQTTSRYKNDMKDRKVILFLNDCSCAKKFCKEKAAIAVQGCLRRITLEDCATDICIEYQKQIGLDGTSEAAPALVGHIHLDRAHLERINISTEDILQKCQEVSGKYGKKKGHLSNLFKNITFSTCDCSFTQKLVDGKLPKLPCLQFFVSDNMIVSESVERAVSVLADSLCGVLLNTIIKGDPRIQEAKIVWVGSDATSWVKNTQKASKGEPAVEIIVEEEEALHIGDAWRTTMDACIPVLNLIDIRRSIPYGIQQVRELLGISCAFDQVVQRLSTTVRMVAKDVLKDHLVLVANSMTFTGNLNGFNNAGYKATFRSLKVQVPFTESTLITPMKCFEKAAEKCHSDSLGCVVSSCSWGKHAASGTGSSFQILWNESQLKSNKEYGDGLYDYLALVRTDEEKARYTFFDDVDYLAEENEADVCLSPELDGTIGQPIFDDNLEEQDVQNNSSWDNGTTTNASWEQNGSAGNDSDKWGGWNDAAAGADTGVTKPADQGNSCWDVPATVEKSSSDWGGWGTEKAKEKEKISEEPAQHDAWSVQGPKRATDGGASWKKQSSTQNDGNSWKENKGRGSNGGSWEKDNAQKGSWGRGNDEAENNNDVQNKSWETVAADAHASTEKSWGNVTASPSDNAWSAAPVSQGNGSSDTKQSDSWDGWKSAGVDKAINKDKESLGNVPASPSFSAWNASPVSQGNERSDAKQSDSWDGWKSAGVDKAINKDKESLGNVPASPSFSAWNAAPVSQGNERLDAKQSDSWDGWKSAGVDDSVKDKESWGNVPASPSDSAWNAAPVSQGNESSDAKQSDSWDGWKSAGVDASTNKDKESWGNVPASPSDSAWNAAPVSQGDDVWNSAEANESRNKDWKSDGWGARGGNWRGQRNNPGRPPRKPDGRGLPRRPDERGPPRRHFDLTAEEEKILGEIEPTVLSIRKIFRESIDSIKLSPEDEKFIKENVLEHHPEKQSKVSGEIDHIMVDKHQVFQDSRCLFVVSSDGTRSDFSYLKCMENFVRKTYPEHGDSFCKKYFKRRRDQPPAADGGTAPGTPAGATQSTAVDTQEGTSQQTQPDIATAPAATQQETLQDTPAPPADDGLLGKGPSPSD